MSNTTVWLTKKMALQDDDTPGACSTVTLTEAAFHPFGVSGLKSDGGIFEDRILIPWARIDFVETDSVTYNA